MLTLLAGCLDHIIGVDKAVLMGQTSSHLKIRMNLSFYIRGTSAKWLSKLIYSGLLGAFTILTGPLMANAKDGEEAFQQRDYKRVLEVCLQPADSGDGRCQFLVGTLFKYGWGVDKDLRRAARWLKRAADQDVVAAQEALGDCYLHGAGVKRDYSEAFRLFKLAERKGNVWAINQLGHMYRFGLHVPKDLNEAQRLVKEAANKANPAAQSALADMYRLGEGVEKNPDEAFRWATKSAKQGWHSGNNMLAILFRDGVGVRQDSAQAIELFKLAAASGRVPTAYCSLGQIYRYGAADVQANLVEAMRWIEEGVKAKDQCSSSVAARILGRGGKGVKADPQRAISLATEGAKSNHAPSINVLGWLHQEGLGTEKNHAIAMEYFQRAASLQNRDAMANLGRAYAIGDGVERDLVKARSFYEQALIGPISPGGKKLAEEFLADTSTGKTQAEVSPVPTVTKPDVSTNQIPKATPSGMALNESQNQQAELMARLDKMQQQLAAIQASSNSANLTNALSKPQIVYANRRALVIGNDGYKHVSPLENAGADAKAIAVTLESVGYQVMLRQDLDEKAFKQTLRDFRLQVQGGDEVLVYFAGHGVQVGSANFLLPVDIKGDNEEQVKDEGIELQRVLDLLRERKAKFSLAIVDACRDNPFKQSGRAIGGRGLAPTTAATGQMVMFSAGAGEQALDRLGPSDKEKNGLFTRVLLKEMIKPGVPVDRVLRNVRAEVVKLASSVGREQTPALYDQAVGDFYFKR